MQTVCAWKPHWPGSTTALILALATTSGCWKQDYAEIEGEGIAFSPSVGAPEGWRVSPFELPLECPDGEDSRLYVVHPEDAVAPLSYALVLHSGAMDWVYGASATNPLSGPNYQASLRLNSDWAFRRIFATLGMYPSDDPLDQSTGAMVAALAEQGIASVLPANCWGDLWHDYPGLVDNDYSTDGFSRQGRTALEFAWRLLIEYDSFAPVVDINLPADPDPEHLYAIGLGDGGRGIGELLHQGYGPRSFALDAPLDDLAFYWEEAEAGDELVLGLERIFPDGAEGSLSGSVASAPALPPRLVLVYGPADPALPEQAITPLLERLEGVEEAWIEAASGPQHIRLNSDILLARGVVSYLLEAPAWEPPEIDEPEPTDPRSSCVATTERDEQLDGTIQARDIDTYDPEGRLETSEHDLDADGHFDERRHYDNAGNITRHSVDEDDDGENDLVHHYTYDEQGRLSIHNLDEGADGRLDRICTWSYTDDAVGRAIRVVESCDDQGDGTPDRSNTTDIIYGYTGDDTGLLDTGDSPPPANEPPDTQVAHYFDEGSDGSVDRIDLYSYGWDDGAYERPTLQESDLDADGVIDEITQWSYNGLGLVTFTAIDEGGEGDADFVATYSYDAEGHLLTEQIDEEGNQSFDILWTYSYDGLWRRILAQGDELVDGSPNITVPTTWDCPQDSSTGE